MRTTLENVRAIDLAWNARRWADYASLLDNDLLAWASGDIEPHGKIEHVQRAQRFCDAFPNARVHIDPYLEIFSTPDGTRSISVARVTGNPVSFTEADGETGPTRGFDVTFALLCGWRNGRIVLQRQFVDSALMYRQLGDIPHEILPKGDSDDRLRH